MPTKLVLIMAVIALFLLSVACASNSDKNKPQQKLLEAMRTEQQSSQIVIGFQNSGSPFTEFMDTTAGMTMKRVAPPEIPSEPATLRMKETKEAQYSSNGKWVMTCHKALCTITDAVDRSKRFSFSKKNILTPLSWSPDNKFMFFIRKAPSWRFPPAVSP